MTLISLIMPKSNLDKLQAPLKESSDSDTILLDKLSIKLATNYFVKQRFISPTAEHSLKEHDLSYPYNNRQTLAHLYVTCPNVQIFWACFIQWWNSKNSNVVTLVKNQILCGVIDAFPQKLGLNLCLIIAKYYIYNASRNEEDYFWEAFLVFLKQKLNTETQKTKQEVKLH